MENKYFIYCDGEGNFSVTMAAEFAEKVKTGDFGESWLNNVFVAQKGRTNTDTFCMVEKYHTINRQFSDDFDNMVENDHLCDLAINGEPIEIEMCPRYWDALNDFMRSVITADCLEYGNIEPLNNVLLRSNVFSKVVTV